MEEHQLTEWEQAYYNALREFWKRVICTRPYKPNLKWHTAFNAFDKFAYVKYPALETYSDLLKFDRESVIFRTKETTLLYNITQKKRRMYYERKCKGYINKR